MSLFDKLMRGDIDGLQRDMKEREFKNMAQVSGHFRDAMCENVRPTLAWWLQNGGAHSPACGPGQKGDLIRWIDHKIGETACRFPTVRADMVQAAVEGKIEVRGTELLLWLASRMNEPTLRAFILLEKKARASG